MFEAYTQNIDQDNSDFHAFIKAYVAAKDDRSPETIPYSQLYALIKEAIREYLRKTPVSKEELKQ